MSEKLLVKRPVYPLIGLLASILIIVFGVVTAKSLSCLWFLGAMWLVMLAFGYWRACLAVIPVAAVVCAVLAGITYVISRDVQAAYAAVNRILAVCIAVIPGLALSPIHSGPEFLHHQAAPYADPWHDDHADLLSLLGGEVRQVREAMKTRGAGSFLSPQIFYRAFLIPLIMRLVNISDTLALSVETRGFDRDSTECSVYKTVNLHAADILFFLLVLAGVVWAVVAR